MKIVNAGFEIMDPLNGEEILKKIERVRVLVEQVEQWV